MTCDVVLPPTYRRNTVNPAKCACQWGPSGHCAAGNCERCPRTEGWHRHGQPAPETHITDARGMVVAGYGISVQVWRAGTPCRWLCPCRCHTTVAALFPAPPRQPARLSASGGNNRIASTDRLRCLEEPQPALLDLEAVS